MTLKPLTDEQIDSLTRDHHNALLDHIYEYGTVAEGQERFVRMLARAVERAHGIGVAQPPEPSPIDMVLHCPKCGAQHIDAPMTDAQYTERLHESPWWELGGEKPERWTNPPHRSHLCHGCGCIWRPADVPTNGVEAIKTRGKADNWNNGLGAPDLAPT